MCFLTQIAKKVWFAASQSRFYREIRELSGNYGFEFRRSSKNSKDFFIWVMMFALFFTLILELQY